MGLVSYICVMVLSGAPGPGSVALAIDDTRQYSCRTEEVILQRGIRDRDPSVFSNQVGDWWVEKENDYLEVTDAVRVNRYVDDTSVIYSAHGCGLCKLSRAPDVNP